MHSSCGIQRLLSHALSNAEKVLSPTPGPRIRTPLGVDEGSGVQRDVIRAAYRQADVLNDIKCTRYVAPANARTTCGRDRARRLAQWQLQVATVAHLPRDARARRTILARLRPGRLQKRPSLGHSGHG